MTPPALPLPLVVLGGSDRAPARLPEQGRDKHPLAGYKGIAIRVTGQPLAALILERARASGAFAPAWVAGPASAYTSAVGADAVIDTDATFGQNVRVALEHVRHRCPGRPLAFLTCDVLPEIASLRRLMQEYARVAPCDMWFPLVRVPPRVGALGQSAWKPAYRLRPGPGEPATEVLPGHLVVVDPQALRRDFIYRLLDLGYRTRNRTIENRRGAMLRGVLLDMLWQDVRQLLRLRPPNVTWSLLRAALPAARCLREGTITRGTLEDTLRKIFVHPRHRRRQPGRRVVVPLVDDLFLARDIDTLEEAGELGASLQG